MQLGRTKLSHPGRRRRRLVGDCFTCGKKGHFADLLPSQTRLICSGGNTDGHDRECVSPPILSS